MNWSISRIGHVEGKPALGAAADQVAMPRCGPEVMIWF